MVGKQPNVPIRQPPGANRHVSNTRMNKSSSRSHAVLQLHVQQTLERTAAYDWASR